MGLSNSKFPQNWTAPSFNPLVYSYSLHQLCFLLPSGIWITCARLNGISSYIMAKEVILIEAGATFSHFHFSQSPGVDDFCRGVGIYGGKITEQLEAMPRRPLPSFGWWTSGNLIPRGLY